jgi:hypothetical protein
MNQDGTIRPECKQPTMDKAELLKFYKFMVHLNVRAWFASVVDCARSNLFSHRSYLTVPVAIVLLLLLVLASAQGMDHFFNEAQRQGRISFYMQSSGEEAIHFGTASCLQAGRYQHDVPH